MESLPHTDGPQAAYPAWFLRKFLRDPGGIASLWPSSARLAARMVAGIDLATASVLEFGPGTGAFTDVLAARMGAASAVR